MMLGFLAGALVVIAVGGSRRQVRLVGMTRGLCRLLLRLLGIQVEVEQASPAIFTGRDRLLVLPNHLSYLDAAILSAYLPAVFVTSREIEETPLLGAICRGAGCLFVERRHKGRLLEDIDQLAQRLHQGFNVTVFPEGTTSPGDQLLPFKSSLLESAMRSRCQVLPVCLRYTAIDGKPYGPSNRDLVAWYGNMTFFPHLLRLMMTRSLRVRLSFLAPVPFREHGSRKILARDVRAQIARRYREA